MDEIEWIALWEEYTRHESVTRDVDTTLETMVEDAHVNHVPVITSVSGVAGLRKFYGEELIPGAPLDTTLTLISRTVGKDQLIDEMIFSFTYTQEIPWMLPGVPPTFGDRSVPDVETTASFQGVWTRVSSLFAVQT